MYTFFFFFWLKFHNYSEILFRSWNFNTRNTGRRPKLLICSVSTITAAGYRDFIPHLVAAITTLGTMKTHFKFDVYRPIHLFGDPTSKNRVFTVITESCDGFLFTVFSQLHPYSVRYTTSTHILTCIYVIDFFFFDFFRYLSVRPYQIFHYPCHRQGSPFENQKFNVIIFERPVPIFR